MSWVENGLLFLAQMKKNRIKPNARTYNTIISLSVSLLNPESSLVHQCVESAAFAHVSYRIWSRVISHLLACHIAFAHVSYRRCARAASAPGGEAATPRAFELLDEMRKASLPPELATYNALLALCAASKTKKTFLSSVCLAALLPSPPSSLLFPSPPLPLTLSLLHFHHSPSLSSSFTFITAPHSLLFHVPFPLMLLLASHPHANRSGGDSAKGEEVMGFLKGDGLAPDSYTFSSLMRLRSVTRLI